MREPVTPLPPLRDFIAAHGLGANKRLGQHFLLDLNLTRKIARSAGDLSGQQILEVGSGPGGLTRALLETDADHIFASERDPRFAPVLRQTGAAFPDRLTVIEDDALSVNEPHLIGRQTGAQLIANLPYNVSTPLLVKWLTADPWPPWFLQMTLMFQKEVADRIVSAPGGKVYGRLSVLSQWRCQVRALFNVPARAFTPPPKVDSAVVQFRPRAGGNQTADFVEALQRITASAFGQRRKMLRTSLKSVLPEPDRMLEDLGIDPTWRAEQLPVAGFGAITEALLQHG